MRCNFQFLIVILLLCLFAAQDVKGQAAEQPNILWITVEDMSPTLGYLGDSYAETPNLDKLAMSSVQYSQAFASSPVCAPSRSTLINGVYSTSLGTQRLRSHFDQPDYMRGFPSYLKEAGYYTTNNFKTDYNTADEAAIIAASFDQSNNTAHWRGKKDGQPFFAIFNDMVTHQSRTMSWSYERFQREVQSLLSEDEIHDPALAPVPPYYPDTPVIRKTIARYYDAISVMDKNVGRILSELEEDGLADDTIIFFYSDHGSGLPRHKRVLQDSGMHVPLMVHFPEKYKHLAPAEDRVILDRLLSFVDFAPTVLSLAGIEIPEYMQGTAFLGAQEGPEANYLFGTRDRIDEAFELARSVRDKRWIYVRNYMPHLSYNQPSAYSDLSDIRKDIYREAKESFMTPAQIHYAGPFKPAEELYDRIADPFQIRNLASSEAHAPIRDQFRSLLTSFVVDTQDLGFIPETEAWLSCEAQPIYDCGRSMDLSEVYATASLVGLGMETRDELVARLSHENALVRYWAAIGLRALGDFSDKSVDALTLALEDSSPSVRSESAAALAYIGETEKSLDVLAAEMKGDDPNAVLRAVRVTELLGERSRPLIASMEEVHPNWLSFDRGALTLFINFSLDAALKGLGREGGLMQFEQIATPKGED